MRPSSKRSTRNPAGLFDDSASSTGDVRSFARAVAQRHRSRPADTAQLVLALRGYYGTLALFAEVPNLDEGAVAIAIAAYAAARGVRPAAA
jgi:hypothetical protein